MPSVSIKNVTVNYPVFELSGRSLKKQVANTVVGGKFASFANGVGLVTALDDISLELKAGDRMALVGHNGAGKSTLLKLIAEIYEPSFGTVEIHGQVAPLLDIGLGLDPDATGYENIVMRGLYLGQSLRSIHKHRDEIGAFSELGAFLEAPVRTYSAGMLSRLLFSVATFFDCEILVIDEGLVVGDAGFQAAASERLDRLIDNSGILVFASHSIPMLQQYCNLGAVMNHGRIEMVGTLDEAIAHLQAG